VYTGLGRKTERKEPLGISRPASDNIKMDLRKYDRMDVDWFHLDQERDQ
jgi:hypothetical protein